MSQAYTIECSMAGGTWIVRTRSATMAVSGNALIEVAFVYSAVVVLIRDHSYVLVDQLSRDLLTSVYRALTHAGIKVPEVP